MFYGCITFKNQATEEVGAAQGDRRGDRPDSLRRDDAIGVGSDSNRRKLKNFVIERWLYGR